jgi:hypothetical protein
MLRQRHHLLLYQLPWQLQELGRGCGSWSEILSSASGSNEKWRSLPMPSVAEDLGGGFGEVVGEVEATLVLTKALGSSV